jgi:alanyl-tRNA synthetase
VRTIRAGRDSFELCGGNHVQRTGDIAYFVITGESGVAAGVRRVEAVVGAAAESLVQGERDVLRALGQSLKTKPNRISERVEAMQEEIRQLKKALKKARQSGGGIDIDAITRSAVEVGGALFAAARVDLGDRDSLGAALEALRERAPDMVTLLGAVEEETGKVMLTAGVGHNLKKNKSLHVGQLIRAVAPIVGGKGGGRPDFANGGGVDATQLDALIAGATEAWRGVVE